MTISRSPIPARRRRARLDARREVVLHHVTDGPAKGWLHTHGLAVHGHPELEIRDVPLFLGPLASRLLNDIAEYLLNDARKPLLAGERIAFGRREIQVLASAPDEAAGYDANHYAGYVRLVLVDPSGAECLCDECARERKKPLN